MVATLNLKSPRVAKARLAYRLRVLSVFICACSFILIAVGGALLAAHVTIGYSCLGVGLLGLMLYIWHHWELVQLLPAIRLSSASERLDAILEAHLLAKVKKWPLSSTELWNLAAQSWQGVFMLNHLLIDPELLALQFTEVDINTIWEQSLELGEQLEARQLDGGIIVAAYLQSTLAGQAALQSIKLDETAVREVLDWQRRLAANIELAHRKPTGGGIARDWASGYTPTLNNVGHNLSREVEQGSLLGLSQMHQSALDQALYYLARDRGSLVLLGDVGAGKTSLVYSLAERLVLAKEAQGLEYYQVISLNAAILQSQGGNVSEMILQILAEAAHARNIILFFDDASLFFDADLQIPEILLPLLQRGVMKIIFAATANEWQKIATRYPAVGGLIRSVKLAAPDESDIRAVMEDAAIGLEHRSRAIVTYSAIRESYRLAERYLPEQAFPGKGIDVLQNALQYPEADNIITEESVRHGIESRMGVKVRSASKIEQKQLLNLEEAIHGRMINQVHAVEAVASALRRSRAGVGNPNRPVGSFLFLGPTGVGKTELAKALAATYFNKDQLMIRLDMTEYQQASDVSRILAAASTAKTGESLIGAIRKQPFNVVLLDEIEKAHPDILNLLLQMLDEGQLTDSEGRKVSFKDAIIIATSNAGADDIRARIGRGEELSSFHDAIVGDLIASHQFRPELLNRFDEIVLFRPLQKVELVEVARLMLAEVNSNLAQQKITVELADDALAWLAEHGYDPQLGARPMRRLMQQTVENATARQILAGELQPGSVLRLAAADLAPSGETTS